MAAQRRELWLSAFLDLVVSPKVTCPTPPCAPLTVAWRRELRLSALPSLVSSIDVIFFFLSSSVGCPMLPMILVGMWSITLLLILRVDG